MPFFATFCPPSPMEQNPHKLEVDLEGTLVKTVSTPAPLRACVVARQSACAASIASCVHVRRRARRCCGVRSRMPIRSDGVRACARVRGGEYETEALEGRRLLERRSAVEHVVLDRAVGYRPPLKRLVERSSVLEHAVHVLDVAHVPLV